MLDQGLEIDVLDALVAALRDTAVIVVDDTGSITYASPSVRRLLGHEPAAVVGTSLLDYLHPDEIEEVLAGLARWQERSGFVRGQGHRVRAAAGSWVDIDYDVTMVERSNSLGQMYIALWPAGTKADTERELWARLQNEDRLTRLATSFVHVPVDQLDEGLHAAVHELGTLEWVTRVSLWRCSPDGVGFVPIHWWTPNADAPRSALPSYVHRDDSTLAAELLTCREVSVPDVERLDPSWGPDRHYFVTAGVTAFLAVPVAESDEVRGALIIESTLPDRRFDATHVTTLRTAAGILAQAFARSDAERDLAYRAQHDQLTGLGNRWFAIDHLEQAIAALRHPGGPGGGVAVLLLDLDRFKVVNDSLGHEAGDELLLALADRLSDAHGGVDGVARFGGDEIVVVRAGVRDATEAVDLGRELQQLVEQPIAVAGHDLFISCSVGVSYTTDPDAAATELLRQADAAVTSAKERGRRGLELFDDRLAEEAAKRLRLETELRRGVRDSEFDVYFQPELDLLSGEVLGAEALLRWRHPTEGLLAAGAFIDIAEETAAIIELGPWVLREACRVAADWPNGRSGRPLTVRVNLSVRQLLQPDLVETVVAALEESAIAPETLCLELTETTLMADADLSLEVLTRLRALGVSLAVDDFGTGYSSLTYLKRFPVDVVKIDRSFVDGLGTDPDDTAIVRAVLGLAEAMGMRVTAEGVETERQRNELLALGCTRAQGFLLGKPMPAAEFAALL